MRRKDLCVVRAHDLACLDLNQIGVKHTFVSEAFTNWLAPATKPALWYQYKKFFSTSYFLSVMPSPDTALISEKRYDTTARRADRVKVTTVIAMPYNTTFERICSFHVSLFLTRNGIV